MPTFEQVIQNNQPVLIVHVSLPDVQQGNVSAFRAILDTGAQRTSVSPDVQNKIGLMPLGTGDMRSASGEITEILKFYARVDIPIIHNTPSYYGIPTQQQFNYGQDMEVFGLPFQPGNYDVLLGMDFISLFHITFYNGRFILSN